MDAMPLKSRALRLIRRPNFRTWILVHGAVLLTAMPSAFAAGDGQGFPWGSFAANLFNLFVFLGIIVYFGGKPINNHFAERRKKLTADLEEAARLRKEAQERLEDYSARLDALEKERQNLLDEYHAQGEREKKRLIEAAKKSVEKMQSDAQATLAQEIKKAVAQLEQQAVHLAVNMAMQQARERLDAGQQGQLVDSYVADLKAQGSGTKAA